MTDASAVEQVLSLYKKHGWMLRRVLLSDGVTPGTLDELKRLVGDTEMMASTTYGLWFSRLRDDGSETWELRRLTGSPFALVVVAEAGIGDDELEARLKETEARMAQSTASAPSDN